MRDISFDAISRERMNAADRATLENPAFGWKHFQTEHFTLHHTQRAFAVRVARMGEQFYDLIAADLPAGLSDRITPVHSHIFIFRRTQDWADLVAETPGLSPWAASFVRGQTMYLQEIGQGASGKMEVLAHEMTHLVFNRFLSSNLPLWLNEGLAEYYGAVAYRASRNLGTPNPRNLFKPYHNRMPLEQLLTARTYPPSENGVQQFYGTAKYLVGFLRWAFTPEQWNQFLTRAMQGAPAEEAMLETYGFDNLQALQQAFDRFGR